MPKKHDKTSSPISSVAEMEKLVSYSFMDSLKCDPDATQLGNDHIPRQVFSGHFVPVKPTPLAEPKYLAHSSELFRALGFDDKLAYTEDFKRIFSGDLGMVLTPMRKVGWACGYALSIYGTEYTQQCPFQTGNGYGDGRAISVLEVVVNDQHWEMQLKGGGKTPYCRGADGRAVLRSSIREFLAQEHMYALGIPTSRSLSLFVSKTEKVTRPWYSEGSLSTDPDTHVSEQVAISTRVARSFIRVGQLELFGRRAKNDQPNALKELEQLVLFLIEREYAEVISTELSTPQKVIMLAREFRERLTSLIANWIRVGYCQGNFNSDNCAAGGFTLDYGPYGFCDVFNPLFQPWTGGGRHFSFLNQPLAAEQNFHSFCIALSQLLKTNRNHLMELQQIRNEFASEMQAKMETMWANKLGLEVYDAELVDELIALMIQTPVDFTLFFRELSSIPDNIEPLKKSFYDTKTADMGQTLTHHHNPEDTEQQWSAWLLKWHEKVGIKTDNNTQLHLRAELARQMKLINPKYTMKEWLVAPAYQQTANGDETLLNELQEVMTQPYAEQNNLVEEKYYRLKSQETVGVGGLSHYSCSS